jgi:hypothetical protein
MVCVDVSVVVFGGSVIVVDTVVVTVSVVLVELLVVWPAAGSVAGRPDTGNTANMRHVGRQTPPFPGGVDGRIHRCKS